MRGEDFEKRFYNPPEEFSPAPLWFWYGRLDKAELSRQIDEMVDKGVYNAFMHPRAYFLTQYLEEEWWDVVGHVIKYSRKKGFRPWIYDEYAWPSGTAGSTFIYSSQKPSRVLAEGERNMAKGLKYRVFELNGPAAPAEAFVSGEGKEKPVAAVFMQMDGRGGILEDSLRELTGEETDTPDFAAMIPPGAEAGNFKLMVFYKYAVPTAVDYLNKETIKSFIKYTHEAYKKRYGEHFGTLIPGVFFDEIFNAADRIVWTDAFEREFAERMGYDIKKYLPLLIYDGAGAPKVRRDYFEVLTTLYEEAFFEQIGNWCEENGLLLTGHTEEELALHPLRQGDYFRTMRHLHIPGGDCHDYRYRYPRKITPIEPKGAVSVARLYGRKRAMSEAMGGGGWATSLQEFKRGVNVLAAMGINFFVLHGFYCETKHQGSQGDWPASFFLQNPYWKNFKVFSRYISRLSYMGSVGKPVCRVGLLYPIASVYESFRDGKADEEGERLAGLYHAILEELLCNQIDTDVLDEASICAASVGGGVLKAGEEAFEAVIIPEADCLGVRALQKLREFEEKGGGIILYARREKAGIRHSFRRPALIEARDGKWLERLKQLKLIEPDFEIIEGNKEEVRYYRRIVDNTPYFLVVNACDRVKKIIARFRARGKPYLFNIETGSRSEIINYSAAGEEYTEIPLTLMEDEAYFIVFNGKGAEIIAEHPKAFAAEAFPAAGTARVLRKGWRMRPLPGDMKPGETPTETTLQIPTALFRSSLDPRWKSIRIQNRRGEAGSCGRHVSLWRASWITRRPSWADDSCESTLYFRKIIEVPEKIKKARLCIAAVNDFELYINGKKAHSGTGWRRPAVCDVEEYLSPGKNLIAVRVSNPTPVQGKNMLEAETFNPDTLTSLLLEGRIETAAGVVEVYSDKSWVTCSALNEGWQTWDLPAEAHAEEVDVKSISFPWGMEYPSKWIFAWERGAPPLLPWGNLPLFGEDVAFPVELQYEITIPAGADMLFTPVVKGKYGMELEGEPVKGDEGAGGRISIGASDRPRRLRITALAKDPSEGLTEPIGVSMPAAGCVLGDWRKTGLPFYSGSMLYENSFTLCEWNELSKCELELGRVNFHAEVWVNGKKAGVRLWKPYHSDITDFVTEGENTLAIVVSNLAANEMRYGLLDEGRAMGWNVYWYEDNIDRDSQNLESGLFGPVTVKVMDGVLKPG